MNSDRSARNVLRDTVEAEGREWMRRRLEQKLPAQVEEHGAISPLNGRKAHHRRRETMQMRTAFGVVTLGVWRGKNPGDGSWGIPIRQRWGLGPHQQLSPALEDKLAYFATVAGTYESAAQLARKMSISIEDSTVRELVQRLGARAEELTQQRLKTVPKALDPKRPPSTLAVIMIDGYQVRHRGWVGARKKT